MSEFTALDPNEGPTVWAKQDESNPHTFIIAEGTDPEDPTDTYRLSSDEIRRLHGLVAILDGGKHE
jgi:hypothetical protein